MKHLARALILNVYFFLVQTLSPTGPQVFQIKMVAATKTCEILWVSLHGSHSRYPVNNTSAGPQRHEISGRQNQLRKKDERTAQSWRCGGKCGTATQCQVKLRESFAKGWLAASVKRSVWRGRSVSEPRDRLSVDLWCWKWVQSERKQGFAVMESCS